MAHKRTLHALLTGLILLSLSSCLKDDFDFDRMTTPELNSDWAVPLLHSDLALRDLLKHGNTYFLEDELTHMLTLRYQTSLTSSMAEDYFKIPDQHFNLSLNSLLFPPLSDTFRFAFPIPCSFQSDSAGQRLDSLFMKEGQLSLNISSNLNHNGVLKIGIPAATKNGQALQAQLDCNIPINASLSRDLSGYRIALDNSPGKTNELVVMCELTLYPDANPNLSPYSFSLDFQFGQIRFSRVFGYFGQYAFPFEDTLNLEVFRRNVHGSFQLNELSLFLHSRNSGGMPVALMVETLKTHSDYNPPFDVSISDHPLFPNPLLIPCPSPYQSGQTKDTTFLFNGDNSNLVQAINISPQYLAMKFTGITNPSVTPVMNFMCDTSRLSLNVAVELPLYGSVAGFWLEDTLDFTMNDVDKFESVQFKLTTQNWFPVNADVQVYFADENLNILDSLLTNPGSRIIQGAVPGPPPDYRVPDAPPPPFYTVLPEPFTKARLERLKQVKKAILRAGVSTTGSGTVKIYSDYSVSIRLGARVNYKF